ncbi:Predicted NTP pyrophosphohydrolase [Nocardia otitidiscaviarum]|uniref:Predicted NTP pyrophosphohydrolase n=1 Tax=Nocardia otitidiscaviarum TaxID=1823 RepID=A0A378YLY3_9NOCA|nr:NUDIX domain-containing protein [Nocardia otitidiscaviarum]SUA78172.1 Predicted NTP pyrophosphohydrolase [Nocardia otitidiscaviarum]
MTRYSAGVLLFRRTPEFEVLIAHMGGPFWSRKDTAAWSIPKGEYDPETEDAAAAARREFTEELGLPVPDGEWIALGEVAYGSGRARKEVSAWAIEADLDPTLITPGTFEMEWPPRSGRLASFPEVDRAAWFSPEAARDRLIAAQRAFLDRLTELAVQ